MRLTCQPDETAKVFAHHHCGEDTVTLLLYSRMRDKAKAMSRLHLNRKKLYLFEANNLIGLVFYTSLLAAECFIQ